jgi:hypothetical protein
MSPYMKDWMDIVRRNHEWAHARDGCRLVTQDGADPQAIIQLEDRLGIHFPDEFHELYATLNGFGVASNGDSEHVWWLCTPLEEIPEFAEGIRKWFRGTHPDVAERFVAFIDWHNGDGEGYLFDEHGIALPGLYIFEHELYGFDEDQDIDEFLDEIPVTIEEFLNFRY